MIDQIIPKCGEHDFPKLEFPEYSEREAGMSDDEYDRQRDSEDGEGYCDIHLRIWMKLESVELLSDGNYLLKFYLLADNDHTDAPYFRHKNSTTVYESEFQACTLAQFERIATKKIKELIKAAI